MVYNLSIISKNKLKAMDTFKVMTSCLNKKTKISEEEIEKIPSYVFLRWLSGSPYTVLAANFINMYNKIPVTNQFYMIRHAFGDKIKFIKYPKGSNEKGDSYELECLMKYFNISLEKAKEYRELIDENELQNIVQMFRKDQK